MSPAFAGEVPALWKLDVDSAFRRLPLKTARLWAAMIEFICGGFTDVSEHYACPFGASASVHCWERVGAMLACIAVRVLWIPAFRYVDDLFGAERQASCLRSLRFA